MVESCCAPTSERDTSESAATAASSSPGPRPEMIDLPGGVFAMGTDDPRGYADDGEGPVHQVELSAFSIAANTVTNAEFSRFVTKTGHVSTAEEFSNSFVFGGLLPDDFPATQGVAASPWWRLVELADWRHPEGPHSDLEGRDDHPVVHVSWMDATAFCSWSGTRLPTEAEWEYAARGGRSGHHFPWGDEREPGGAHKMNVFQGQFPGENSGEDGWTAIAPVRSFPANDFGLYETTGNVWEWTADWFDPSYYERSPRTDPKGPDQGERRVIRGGSYLCHESYCWRYRVDSRSANTPDSTTGNTGFRVALDG